jgi:tetratricopeptide (TPR) repeat protein
MPPAPASRSGSGLFSIRLLLLTAVVSIGPARAQAQEGFKEACTSSDPAAQETQANSFLDAGNKAFEAGDFRGAEEAWTAVSRCPQTAPSWPKAMFNLGLLEERQEHYPRAIGYFQSVLDSHPNDKEPGANLMQVYRNYSHRSVLSISECYEKMGQFQQALRYARLAQTRYPYQSWCGTCLMLAQASLARRLAYLTFRSYGGSVMTALVLGGVVLHWRRKKRPR